jgi:hypothetical protein
MFRLAGGKSDSHSALNGAPATGLGNIQAQLFHCNQRAVHYLGALLNLHEP